ncbi:ABC transporter substrate-binding protein [Jiangella muralis]|uniref:ABC transporter substrate-binding protein n=1 Tax=Jiangella muralis TaxID=702383 RepID=UPI00069D9C31|nr:extracellular solute-binding protein [Jiangella muralis]
MTTRHTPRTAHRRGPARTAAATAAAALTIALTAAACGSPGTDTPADASTEGAGTDLGDDPVVVDITIDTTQVDSLRPITDAFTALHPNVTFEITGEQFDALQQNAARLMTGDDPPDLISLPTPGNTVEDGLVRNLDDYAEAYGWTDFPASQLNQWRVDDDGTRGTGSLYGMGIGFTLTGVYYNKTLAEQAGIDGPPATLAEFEQDLAAAATTGATPLVTSGKDGLVFFPYQSLLLAQGTAKPVTEWVFNAPGASIDTPEAVEAARTLQDWAAAGYLAADVSAVDASTAAAQFAAGEGVYFVSGNWQAATLGQQLGDDVGFFLFPAADDHPRAAMSDPANFVIPAAASDADAAAAFLDFTFTDEGRQLIVTNKGLAPGGPSDAPAPESDVAVVADAATAFTELGADDGIVPFMGNATASFFSATLTPQLQLLLAGRVTPEDFAATLQADYESQVGG